MNEHEQIRQIIGNLDIKGEKLKEILNKKLQSIVFAQVPEDCSNLCRTGVVKEITEEELKEIISGE